MVKAFGNIDIQSWVGELQHNFILSSLISVTNQPKKEIQIKLDP